MKNTPEASGSATPVVEDEDSISTPTRTTRGKSIKKNLNEASFFDKIDPKKAAALKSSEFSRKSPRGHASTKSYLNTHSPYVDDDDEVFEELLQGGGVDKKLAYLDECSNDSVLSISSANKKNFKTESLGQLIEIANSLDAFLCEEDPLLMAQTTSDTKKRSRRQSSSDKVKTVGRQGRRSKDHDHQDHQSQPGNHPGLDKIVDSNIDPVFLDCLEDELPSVTFEDPIRSNDPMEWIDTYDQCTSINFLSKKSKKLAKMIAAAEAEKEKATNRDSSLENENLVVCHSKDPQSTILRRLLTSSGAESPSRTPSSTSAKKKLTKKSRNFVKPNDIDSSSECASVTESVASSNSNRRKKKRNMTGFPSPKKKRKLITPSLTPKAGPSSSSSKTSGGPPRKAKGSSNNTNVTPVTPNIVAKGRKNKGGRPSSIQMQLKLGKNGISLQKPTKPSAASPAKTTGPAGKRGRPVAKSKQPATRQTPTNQTVSNAKGSAKIPKQGIIKGRKVFLLSEDEDPIEDDESFDDEEDDNFSPSGRSKKKSKGPKTKGKKKKRRLNLPQKKKFLLVKPGQKPKVITIESNDEDEDDSDENEAEQNNIDVSATKANDTDFSSESDDSDGDDNSDDDNDDDEDENDDEDGEEEEEDSEEASDEGSDEDSDEEENEEEASDDDNDKAEDDGNDDDEEDIPIKATRNKNLKKNLRTRRGSGVQQQIRKTRKT